MVSVVAEPTEEYPTKGMRLLAKTLFYAADGIVMQTADAVRFFQPSLQKKMRDSEKFPESGICAATV